jgi:branched-chain amino acid transport system substrate-binding protein
MTRKFHARRALLTAVAAGVLTAGSIFAASAQAPKPLRIGVIDDLSGPNSVASGPGTIEATKMAVEDFGGKVLGRPVEVLVATDENKPDLAVAIAKKWFENDGVAMITGLPISNSALAVQNLAAPADRIVIVAVAGATDLTGAQCSTHAVHWQTDTYAASAALVDGIMQKGGGKKWFFITVDYIFGKDIQAQATKQIVAKGGQVLGQVLHPGGNLDFSSAIIAAQQSGADVIGVASGGQDMENTIKAAREFGLTQGGKQLALFFLQTSQVQGVGQDGTQGSMTATWFQPALNAETMAWTDRFVKRVPGGRVPTALNFGAYSSTTHYLKAVEAAGTDDAKTVMAKMKSMPVDDMVFKGGSIRQDGRVLRDMTLVQVKAPKDSKSKFDYFEALATIPKERAFRPMAEGGCSFVK